MNKKKLKQYILDTVHDLVQDFLYYDSKDVAELKVGEIDEAIQDGIITVDEIVEHFRKELLDNLDT